MAQSSQNMHTLAIQVKDTYLPIFEEIIARYGFMHLLRHDDYTTWLLCEDATLDEEYSVMIFDSDRQEHSFFYDTDTPYGAMTHEVVLKMLEINDADPDPYAFSLIIDGGDPLFRHDLYNEDGGGKWGYE